MIPLIASLNQMNYVAVELGGIARLQNRLQRHFVEAIKCLEVVDSNGRGERI
jgi:hypothetical protein